MTARRYAQVGPFPDEVFMEDFELTRRIRRQAIAEGGAYVWLPWCWWCRSMLAVAVHQRWLRACRYVCPASYPILPAVALCDGRRWEMNGVLKNTLLNQYFVWLYVACRALTKRDGHSSHAWLREQIHKPWVHPRPDLQHVLRQQDQAGRNPATNGPPINRVALVTGTASSAGVVERNSALAKQQCMPVGREPHNHSNII